jgi:ATP/maltotriose-dependent transcriptional regulator MalT
MVAHASLGNTLTNMGEFTLARTHLEQGIALTDPEAQRTLALRYGQAPGMHCLVYAALALWCLGYPDQGLERSQTGCTLARELGHPLSLASALNLTARLHLLRGEAHAAREQTEALIALATERTLPQYVAMGRFALGWALAAQGQGAEGVTLLHQGVTDMQAMGNRVTPPSFLPVLAEVSGSLGLVDAGVSMVTEALELVEQTGVRCYEAETTASRGPCCCTRPSRMRSRRKPVSSRPSTSPADRRPNPGNCAPPPAWPACGSPRTSARTPKYLCTIIFIRSGIKHDIFGANACLAVRKI